MYANIKKHVQKNDKKKRNSIEKKYIQKNDKKKRNSIEKSTFKKNDKKKRNNYIKNYIQTFKKKHLKEEDRRFKKITNRRGWWRASVD